MKRCCFISNSPKSHILSMAIITRELWQLTSIWRIGTRKGTLQECRWMPMFIKEMELTKDKNVPSNLITAALQPCFCRQCKEVCPPGLQVSCIYHLTSAGLSIDNYTGYMQGLYKMHLKQIKRKWHLKLCKTTNLPLKTCKHTRQDSVLI